MMRVPKYNLGTSQVKQGTKPSFEDCEKRSQGTKLSFEDSGKACPRTTWERESGDARGEAQLRRQWGSVPKYNLGTRAALMNGERQRQGDPGGEAQLRRQ
jgi:hypothetical protein